MRRLLPLLVLAAAACGGSDEPAASTIDAATDASTVPTEVTIVGSPLQPADGCETTPDPADYPEGEIPPAIKPCDIPEALVTHTIRSGTGRNAQDGDTLIVDYIGMRAEDGTIFDESYTRAVPLDFPLGRGGVIQGWDDGLIGTQAGSLVKLDIPAELAYGDSPRGDVIQAGDALTFVVDVMAITPAADQ